MRAKLNYAQCAGLLAGVALTAIGGVAYAQTASQITPQTFQPDLQRAGGGFDLPETSGQAAPAGAEKLTVRLKAVNIEGGLASLSAEEAKLKASLPVKTVTAADLFAAANALQEAYAAQGYSLVRVVLPAQRLVNGATLKIVVIDGFLEKIDTSKLPETIRGRVDAVLSPLLGQKGVTRTSIERQLLLAGDLPGTVLRSTLARGEQAGGSVLTIEARYKPVTGSLTTDNRLSDTLGKYNLGVGVEFNSLLGLGEQFYLRASGAPRFGDDGGFFSDAPRNRSLAGGVTLPLGTDGLTLNLEATASRTVPEAATSGLEFQSDFTRYSARLNYPAIRSRDLTVNLTGAFDAQDETLELLSVTGTPLSKDRLRIIRAGTDVSWYAPTGGILTGGLTGSFGLNAFGARTLAEASASGTPLSRQGADADFQKFELSLGYTQSLAKHLTLDIKARAQTAFGQPLLNSEQIGLASTTGLSTFPSGLMQGDDGFVLRAEAQFPFFTPFTLPFALPEFPAQQGTGLPADDVTAATLLVSPYLFGAYGGVKLHDPTALETAWTRGASYGAGVRLGAGAQSSFTSSNLTLEYGRVERFGIGENDNRFTLSAGFQF